ncbi:unnamed protein product [Prorocentrum cordatum]|uniref:Uncharacterized protein n=1 Tax=Prorocentrum cordatum TaxID=2364126 RepID=A0ABN9Y7Y3_9DINO|nr:unnamed protein product [Polarella glacialis]
MAASAAPRRRHQGGALPAATAAAGAPPGGGGGPPGNGGSGAAGAGEADFACRCGAIVGQDDALLAQLCRPQALGRRGELSGPGARGQARPFQAAGEGGLACGGLPPPAPSGRVYPTRGRTSGLLLSLRGAVAPPAPRPNWQTRLTAARLRGAPGDATAGGPAAASGASRRGGPGPAAAAAASGGVGCTRAALRSGDL